MQKNNKTLPRLAAAVTVLMLLNLFALVLTAEAIVQVRDSTPVTTLELTPEPAPTGAPETATKPWNPGAQVDDVNGQVWTQNTDIVIFHAMYDNDLGKVTVRSTDGDSLIAPGTADQYYFHVRNTGNTPIFYSMSAHADVYFASGDTQLQVPLRVRLSNHEGEFLVGGERSFEPVEALEGVTDGGALSPEHYAKYTLEWEWPYESGDDALDTLLGNLAAAGDEIRVAIAFNVQAEADVDGQGGLPPQTGDNGRIALWASVYVCSGFALIILLFRRRKEETNDQ